MKRTLRKAGIWSAGILAVWVLIATGLALSPPPRLSHPQPKRSDTSVSCRGGAGVRCLPMRDGARLAARELVSDGPLIVLYIHGVLGSGAEFEEGSRMLREATGATVVRLDLRGHGRSAGAPGDLEHIGQWEEDVADVVSALRKDRPDARIILAGHSMGGGIAMRYAKRHTARRDVPAMDAYLLFAPLLGDDSPTARKEPAGGAKAPQPIQVHVPRLIGLAMLNAVGIRGWNGLETLFFDLPFPLPTPAYTFRAMVSMAPDDYRAAFAADTRPLLVLVGQNDEAFHAHAYPAVAALHRNGRAVIIAGETHDGIIRSQAAFDAVRSWMPELFERREIAAAR